MTPAGSELTVLDMLHLESMVPFATERQRAMFALLEVLGSDPKTEAIAHQLNEAIGYVVCEAEERAIEAMARRVKASADDLVACREVADLYGPYVSD
jgi:hypothetical protein